MQHFISLLTKAFASHFWGMSACYGVGGGGVGGVGSIMQFVVFVHIFNPTAGRGENNVGGLVWHQEAKAQNFDTIVSHKCRNAPAPARSMRKGERANPLLQLRATGQKPFSPTSFERSGRHARSTP